MEKCASLELVTKTERAQIQQFIDEYIAENPYLWNNSHIEYLLCGVASHHAGLLPSWKILVEKLFQKGLIKVVFATETLAAGINMPARSTVISSVSKRTDSGHRMLTASEFLQMSGRAGRRGMDEIGYVTVVGTQFQSPEEVAELVLSDANPLESRFSPSYSMVLNLLQRFSLDEAKELILKSFGYFSAGTRLQPLLKAKEVIKNEIKSRDFVCPNKLSDNDMHEYDKVRHIYIQNRQTYKKICKQERAKNRPLSKEAIEFGRETKAMLAKMHTFQCDNCKLYRKHMKNIEVVARFNSKLSKMDVEIERQKDIFWNRFLAHRSVLIDLGYIKDDYPTLTGITTSQVRSENELFVSEIIFSGILENLTPAQLAGVVCAITTEDLRIDLPHLPISEPVRKTLNLIKNIKRKLEKIQGKYAVEDPMYINAYFSSLIELWVEGAEWETITEQVEMGEGDIVRAFKRVVDVLRQFTIIDNVPEALVFVAREAIDKIQREPVNID
jgi:superfamily II RNA helicase